MSEYVYYLHNGPDGRDSSHFNRVKKGSPSSDWLDPLPFDGRTPKWSQPGLGWSKVDLERFVKNGHGRRLCVGRFKRECDNFDLDWSLLL